MRSNRIFRIFRYTILALAAFFVLLLLAVNLPPGQRIIASKVNGYFRDKNIPAHVDEITLLLNGKIGLKYLAVIRNSDDTLLYAENLRVAFNPIALIFKKVKVGNLSLDNAVVNLATDDSTGVLNLIALFPSSSKTKDTTRARKKQWDIRVRSVSLNDIQFKYRDVYHGIQIRHSSKNMYVRFSRFSILAREIYASYINLEQITFHIAQNTPLAIKLPEKEIASPIKWKFNLKNADLKYIIFSLDQPETMQKLVITLGEGTISNSHVDLGQHIVDAGFVQLGKPELVLCSSTERLQKKASAGNEKNADFPGPWDMTGDFLQIEEGSLRMLTYDGTPIRKTGPDLSRFDHFETTLKHVKLTGDASGFSMSRLALHMGNGLSIEQGKVVFASGRNLKTQVHATLKTTFSHIDMRIETGEGLPSLIRKGFLSVPVSLWINKSEVSLRDLYSFMPPSEKRKIDQTKDDRLVIHGTLSGSMEHLLIKELAFSAPAGLRLMISGSVSGLPDLRSTSCNLTFGTNPVTNAQVKELLELAGSASSMPAFDPMVIRGSFKERILAPEITLAVHGGSGNIAGSGAADIITKSYRVKLAIDDLDAGQLGGIKEAGKVTGKIDIRGKGFKPDSIMATADVEIEKAGFRGYVYRDVKIEAKAEAGLYTFHILSGDPSAQCNLTGHLSRRDSVTDGEVSGNFALQTGNLNLYKDSIDFSGNLKATLHKTGPDAGASLEVRNLSVKRKDYTGTLKRTFVSFLSTGDIIRTRIESDFLKADFQTHTSPDDFKKAFSIPEYGMTTLLDSTMYYELPVISNLPDANLTAEATYDPLIGLFIADSLLNYRRISVKLKKERDGIVMGKIFLDKYRFMNISGLATSVEIESSNVKTSIEARTDSIRFGNIKLGVSETGLVLTQNKADVIAKIRGRDNEMLYDISCVAVKRNSMIEIRSNIPKWILNGNEWNVSPNRFLVYEPSSKNFIADLHWEHDQSFIDLTGSKSDTLNLNFQKVAISKILVPGIIPFSIDGILNGSVDYFDRNQMVINTKMDIMQIQASGQMMGDVSIIGQYQSDTLGSEGNVSIRMADNAELTASARLGNKPAGGIHTKFKNISVNYLEPFLQKYVNGLTGKINGSVDLTYAGENPELNGSIGVSETGFRIIPLNAKFLIPNDDILIKNSEVIFDQFVVLDSLRKRLNVQGKINLNSRPDPTADLTITSENLQVMNTTEKDNPAFNGSVFINSRLKITGPVQQPSISGNLVLGGGTVINYQYMENLTVSETEKTIRFASIREDQSDNIMNFRSVKKISNSPVMEASIEINPNSIFNFKINRGFDIGVKITGGGFLNYSMMPNSTMSLTGRYEISQGNADLKIIGWPRKYFSITSGSYLRWDGKVDDPELQVETITKVKGSYLNPVDNKNREVDFKVYMKLASRLSQLDIIFDVISDDQYITSVLNSLSKDERMRQAINLLIFERIELPNMASSSDYLSQQINQFWESQLNQFTKSSFKNVDISFGLNTYTGATESGGEEEYTSFTYEVKKEMFNKRGSVMVSGKMNDNTSAGEQANNVIDNFTFEYALDTNRSKYLKVYRQQNYEDLLEGEVIKSGIGFIYRKNYDRLRDIWRKQKKQNPKPLNK